MSGECQKCNEHTLDCTCEKINHPSYYQGKKFEVIDIIEDFELGFNLGNAVKYILRAEKKGGFEENLSKAIWYLQREISRMNDKSFDAPIMQCERCVCFKNEDIDPRLLDEAIRNGKM